MGASAEDQFNQVVTDLGVKTRYTEFQEQIKHIDFHLAFRGSVDVKARKRITRNGPIQDEYVWIEFVGNSGKKGWLYGDATHIAFERLRDFVVVPREGLARIAEILVEDTIVNSPEDAHLFRYQRKGKKDQVSLIPMRTLILNLPCLLLKK
tara:strand:- start:1325 stop:1777 length:453 start_codon:yes stop_codon:yes gene_type:complete